VEEGRPVFSLITTENSWVEANLKETDLTHVKVGQEAVITVDAYPGREFRAKVVSISPATGAEFAVLPPQNATGNWVKVVQRLPVKLELQDFADDDSPLRAGMTVAVTIDTKHKRAALVALERTLDGRAHAAD
jgi:membrane fusion protein (multidrug efflux system)